MKTKLLSILVLIFLISCQSDKNVEGVYRYFWGKQDGYNIWFVDGYKVRHKIYQEFLYGGNEQRYLFNPKGEIWIDHAVSCEEFQQTLAHELNERHLMAKYGWTYDKSHDSSLNIEVVMRRNFNEICRKHEAELPKLPITDYSNRKELLNSPDSVQLQNIYRIPLGKRDSMNIWIVDGYLVRATIFPDFGFSGDDLTYHFIPSKEIWIDGQISAEETEYSIALELLLRNQMSNGKSFSEAYGIAIDSTTKLRNKMEELIKQHPLAFIPDSTTRDAGIIDPNEK
jgi:hypothetical protein